ncbi:hypothetical protein V1260_04350 [Brachybacterium sp. J144]|uniref:hypothetical protein n=1 Tax=Brachybacterium sp. J144 TaxID=3116487 RepID=UPI002E791A8C|nr:hypothetical protein [Brachybacterium sp. J144]MEE1650014.1 hypothetical protein [Brachybacterium sp. J144]
MTTTEIETALRSLDPAPPQHAGREQRAEADLRRILATTRREPEASDPRSADADDTRPRAGSRRHPLRRRGLLALAAAALVVTTAVVAVDLIRPPTASAGWTPVGDPVAVDAPGVQQCARWWRVESDRLRPLLQEQRGSTTLVLAGDEDGRELLCTATLIDGREPIGGMTSLEEPPAAAPGADDVVVGFVQTSFQEAMPQNGWQAEGSTAISGHVGEDVTRLVLDTERGPVEASVADGRFAAWWPIEDDSDPHPVVPATITLADGTTRTVTLEESA